MLEGKPMEKLSKQKQLVGYKHKGFWQCMDTLKEKEYLASLIKEPHHGKTKKFFSKKKIFITGHTGFKGSWLTETLINFGSLVKVIL